LRVDDNGVGGVISSRVFFHCTLCRTKSQATDPGTLLSPKPTYTHARERLMRHILTDTRIPHGQET